MSDEIVTPAERSKPIHRGKLIGPNGEVSPLCASRPKAIDLSVASWSNRDEAVTCLKCLKRLATTQTPPPDAAGLEG